MTSETLSENDIPWRSAPIARCEDSDVLAMTSTELLAYAADLQNESRWLRRLLHESLVLVAKQNDDLTRAARVADALRRELRAFYEDAVA